MENIPDIPTQTIVIVAGGCAVVILVLIAVLLYFCCRRREPRKDFEANPAHRRPQAMAVQYPTSGSPHNQSSNSIASGKPYAMVPPSGYHEAVPTSGSNDRFDGSVMTTSLGSKPQVFTTSQSSKDPLRPDNPSVMDLPMTPLSPDGRPMSPPMNGDAASMVAKPRKVIYEVVV